MAVSRAQQRKDVKEYLKLKLNIKAPRTGKKFKENIEKMDNLYKNMADTYQKVFLGNFIREYYFKYNKRHKNRQPLDISVLKGGALNDCCDFCDKEGKGLVGGTLEKHTFLYDKEGKLKRANYMGAGTDILKRLRKGDKPISKADKISMAHDIQYTMAKTYDDIRKADKIMVRDLTKLYNEGGDSAINILQGKMGILGKMFLENYNILPYQAFTGHLNTAKLSKTDRYILEDNLNKRIRKRFK
jgi:hypothetical protein